MSTENFNWKYYINKYEDLRNAGIDNENKALIHWNNHGLREGRICNILSENFNWKYYINKYEDLRNAGIDNENKALLHWNNHGLREGRICNILSENFNWKYYVNKYKDLKDAGINNKNKELIHWNNHGIKEGRICNISYKNIIIYTYSFNENCGGIVALHNLAKIINELDYNSIVAKLYVDKEPIIKNNICNNYLYNIDLISKNDIIIYPEIIDNNPLCGNNVIRWILLENNSINTFWKDTDLQYHWEPLNNAKQLCCPYFNPIYYNKNYENRNNTCYIIKKGKKIHKKVDKYHDNNSICIDSISDLNIIVETFNTSKYFYCYDPNCFFIFYANICGCLVILQPIENVSRSEFFSSRMLQYGGKIYDYGIAYGNTEEELEYAKNTLPFANSKINEIKEYYNNIVKIFLDDMDKIFFNK
jgi:hypothetical protein